MASSRPNAHSLELWKLFAFDIDLEQSTMRFGRPANRSASVIDPGDADNEDELKV